MASLVDWVHLVGIGWVCRASGINQRCCARKHRAVCYCRLSLCERTLSRYFRGAKGDNFFLLCCVRAFMRRSLLWEGDCCGVDELRQWESAIGF